MKTIHYVALFVSLFFSTGIMAQQSSSDSLTWYTDLMKAQEVSSSTGKPVFAFFTGSDWCGWCKKLQKEVFAKQEFIDWAKKNVILLELDFPKFKQQTPELKQQNQQLLQQFKVQGFPTVWFFYLTKDEKAKSLNFNPLGSCGYPENAEPGREQVKFLKDANSILEKKTAQ